MTTMKYLFSAIACFLLSVVPTGASAQETAITLQGKVSDGHGNPMVDVTVRSSKGRNTTITDFDGVFFLEITDGSKQIVFDCPGFLRQRERAEDEQTYDIKMKFSSYGNDNMVQTGLSVYRKIEMSGSVASVYGTELEKSPTLTTPETFAGRIPGLITREIASDPASATTRLWLRGASTIRMNTPAIVIDGVVFDYAQDIILNMMTPEEIESVTVLKDAASQAIYGIQGGDGLIVINTKKGRTGDLRINVRADALVQQVTTAPTIPGSAAYAVLRNQAAYNDGHGKNFFFSNSEVGKFHGGEDREHFPNNNWYDMFFRQIAFVQRANVDASGGTDVVKYYANANFMHQGSMFKVENGKFNSNFQLYWINFRSNIDVKINRYLGATLKLSGNIKRDNTPTTNASSLYESLFQLPPSMYGPLTPDVKDPLTEEILVEGGNVMTTEKVSDPFYGRLNRTGYGKNTYTNLFTEIGLNLDMGFLTEGLKLSGTVGYRAENTNMLNTTQSYERWIRTGNLEEINLERYGTWNNGALNPSKAHVFCYLINYNGKLDYTRSFGKHHLAGMAYMFYQHLIKNDTNQPWNLPYDRMSSGLELSYNYDDRYVVKFDVGYSGSEQYHKSSRYVWTPAFSAAYIVSNEAFMKEASWLSMLKLRASYGQTATDRSGLSRFAYLDDTSVIGSPNWLNWMVVESGIGNMGIHAEKIKKQNYGIDLGLFNQLNISFDYFKERTDDMVIRSTATIPDYYGYPEALYPYINGGSFENKGFEISVDYFKTINRNWSFGVGGHFSDIRNKILNNGEIPLGDDYVHQYREQGFSSGQAWGFLTDNSNGNGFYNFQDEIDNSPQNTIYNPRLGDVKLRDVNGDGIIDVKDAVPLGTGGIPRQYYGFYGNLRYKDFEFSVLFQGVGKWQEPIMNVRTDASYDGIFNKLHEKAWTFERFVNGENITYPALKTTGYIDYQDEEGRTYGWDYFVYDRSYLRLKNLEIAYNFPAHLCKKWGIGNLRVALSGQNLLTWHNMKTNDFGPESTGPHAFPVMRLYNLGITLQF